MKIIRILLVGTIASACLGSFAAEGIHRKTGVRLTAAFKKLEEEQAQKVVSNEGREANTESSKLEKATFGNGCFWCTEAVFEQLKGVKSAVSGYSGGQLANPTYEQVCSGLTGHAEVIQVEFDPRIISFAKLLEVFWTTHDPTTLNRQGADIGTQYRSAIFYHNENQKELAAKFKTELDKSNAFRDPIVTEITEFDAFYPAKDYHQEFFALNGRHPYCKAVIRPKMKKVKKVFKDYLKAK